MLPLGCLATVKPRVDLGGLTLKGLQITHAPQIKSTPAEGEE